eukprot:g10441.t1
MSGDEKYKVVSKENDEDDAVKRGLTEYEASIKIGKFFRVKEKLRFLARKKKNTARMVRKIFFYIFFVLVTLYANYELSEGSEYQLVQRLKATFFEDNEFGEQAMAEVASIGNFWEYMETRFLPQYYSTVTFDGKDHPELQNDIFAYNRKVGGIRIGQVRLKKKPCVFDNSNFELGNSSFSCYGNRQNEYKFAMSEEDKRPYRLFDGVLNEDIVGATGNVSLNATNMTNRQISFVWEGWNTTGVINGKTSTEREKTFSSDDSIVLGVTFPSPAYSIVLPQNDEALATHLIAVMKDNSYFDIQTSCLFIDFSLYNPMVDRFLSVRLTFVQNAWGGLEPKAAIKAVFTNPLNFLRKSPVNIGDPMKMIHGISYIFELFIYVIFLTEEISKMIAMQMGYFHEFTADIALHWTSIILYFLTSSFNYVAYFVYYPGSHPDDPKINPSVDEFLYLRDYFQSVDSGRIIIGVNILVIMVRLIWLFSNAAPSFALILHTLEASMYRLTNFFVILMFFLIGFSFLAMILFGQEIRGFQTLMDCFVSLFKAILGDIDLAEMQETHGKWGVATAFYIVYMLIMNVVVLNISIAILSDAYAEQNEVIANASDVKISKEMKKFVLIKIWQIPCIGPYLQRIYLYGFESMMGERYRKAMKKRKAALRMEKLQEERHAIKKRPLYDTTKARDEKDKALLITKAGVQQTLKELRSLQKKFESMTSLVKEQISELKDLTDSGKAEIDSFLFTNGHGELDEMLAAEKQRGRHNSDVISQNSTGPIVKIGELKSSKRKKKYIVHPEGDTNREVHEHLQRNVSKGLMKVDHEAIIDV